MKKLLIILTLIMVAAKLSAQTSPQAKSKSSVAKVDTNTQDRMPVIKPRVNSKMPIVKPRDNSKMPIVKPVPDTIIDRKKRTTPKR